jgi:hypothetical protein
MWHSNRMEDSGPLIISVKASLVFNLVFCVSCNSDRQYDSVGYVAF